MGLLPRVFTFERLRQVLHLDASNIEAIASLAGQYFYNDQPEIALRFYRRLLQMGVGNTEIWNNVGLCCFYSAQYDMTLTCFERALALADDSNMADVWCVDFSPRCHALTESRRVGTTSGILRSGSAT